MPRMQYPPSLSRLPRLSIALLISVLLLVAVAFIAPQQLPVSLYKLSLVTLAGVVGYWLDREMFPYARPDKPQLECRDVTALMHIQAAAMIRRAIIVGCAMLAMGLGA